MNLAFIVCASALAAQVQCLEDTYDTMRTNRQIPYALTSKIVKLRVKENLEITEAKGKKR